MDAFVLRDIMKWWGRRTKVVILVSENGSEPRVIEITACKPTENKLKTCSLHLSSAGFG